MYCSCVVYPVIQLLVMQNRLLFTLLSLLSGSLVLLYIFMYTFACRYSNSLICTPFLVHIEFNRYDQIVLQQQQEILVKEGRSFSDKKCGSQLLKLEEIRNASHAKHSQEQKLRSESARLIILLEEEIRRVKELKAQNDKLLQQLNQLSERNNSHVISKLDINLNMAQFEKATKELDNKQVFKYRDPDWVVVPWTVFSGPNFQVYQLEKGTSGSPAVYPEPDRKEEIEEALDKSIKSNILPASFMADPQEDNIYARTRSAAHIGTIYDIYYQHKKDDPVYSYARLIKPFAPVGYTKIETLDRRHTVLNVVLPIRFNPSCFAAFLTNFTMLTYPRFHRWQLTIAYHGQPDKAEEMEKMLKEYATEQKYKDYHFLRLPANYSRGQAIIKGVESWKRSDILTVVTEAHIVFDVHFLHRCIKFAVRGSQIYYPYTFGLYNPNIVYKRKYNFIPSFNKQMVLNVHKGYWLDQDYSTWAAYRSDILSLPGLTELTSGWHNDVMIFRLMARAQFTIVRAPDRSLFLAWHEMHCDPDKEPEGFYAVCMEDKARLMGPPHTLGMIAFGIKTKAF